MKKEFVFNKSSDLYYGIGSNHDFAGCIVKDGKVLCAIEAERINRIKHGYEGLNTFNSVSKYLFDQNVNTVHSISTCDNLNTRNISEYIKDTKFYNHHLCHAAAVFFTSPYAKSAILIGDGLGSRKQDKNGNYQFETVSLFYGDNTDIKEIKKVYGEVGSDYDEQHVHKLDIPNSLGIFYTYVTKIVGFNFLEDGKTMGLAPFGDPQVFYKELSQYIVYKEGYVKINFTEDNYVHYKSVVENSNPESMFKVKADFAAAGQKILEQIMLFYVNYLYEKTGAENLCLGGGVALNSVANGRILRESKFKNIFVFPACGDSSIAIGSAMLSFYKENKVRVINELSSPFLGKNYSESEIEEVLKLSPKLVYSRVDNISLRVAHLLSEDKVVAWFQGKSEFGPRALGHRSILANPLKLETKDYINKVIKQREDFRPFAPAVLYEKQTEYFESSQYNPYMLFVDNVKKEYQEKLKAVTHVDGSVRVQSVDKNNDLFYNLICEFYKLTGIAVVLNTSFNTLKDEPVVETPQDAVKSFLNSKLEYLAIGGFLCNKN